MKEQILVRMHYLEGQIAKSKEIVETDSYLARFHDGRMMALKSEYEFLEKLVKCCDEEEGE